MTNFHSFSYSNYEGLETIRVYPENYWLASIKDKELIFDSWDGAIKYRFNKNEIIDLWNHGQIPTRDPEIRNCYIEATRHAHRNVCKTGNNNSFACIVKTKDGQDYESYGVQFWTNEMIKERQQENTDHSISLFIEKL